MMSRQSVQRFGRQTCLSNTLPKTLLMRLFIARPLQRLTRAEIAAATSLSEAQAVELIAELQQEKVPIGNYRLHQYFYDPQPATLHPDVLAAQLNTRWWGRIIYFAEQLTSTIDIARQAAALPQAQGCVVTADQQTRGRGRQGNRWVSRPGRDLLVTFLVQTPEWQPSPSLLSLYTTTAVARVLDTAYEVPISIKWPNDLMVGERKLGGVLVERDEEHGMYRISMGLNVLTKPEEFPEDLRAQVATLAEFPRHHWQRDLLLAQCGTTWEALWEAMLRDGGATVRGYWKRYSSTLGKYVTFQHRGKRHEGFTRDIDDYGRLIIRIPGGEELILPAEEVQQVRTVERAD
jgi:BirA family biotin operon repressor/biotin-[acetyl-CoA-carboxylase] ligase